jgi:putative Mn2+ efflux pump MntP
MVAVGLAMDVFAVSLGAGASGQAVGGRAVFRLSFYFGLFQFMMPVIGRRPQRRPLGFHPADPPH